VVVAFKSRDSEKPVFKRGFSAKLFKLEVGLDEDVLADIVLLSGILGKTGRKPKDSMLVPQNDFVKGFRVPIETGPYQIIISCRTIQECHRPRLFRIEKSATIMISLCNIVHSVSLLTPFLLARMSRKG
jgi:hypothetical protein